MLYGSMAQVHIDKDNHILGTHATHYRCLSAGRIVKYVYTATLGKPVIIIYIIIIN